MNCATSQSEVMVSNHLGGKGPTDIANKEFHNTEDFLFIEGFEGVFKDELSCPINKPEAGSICSPLMAVLAP
eukprot:4864541-Ditylum_brightwellii.AAC.1